MVGTDSPQSHGDTEPRARVYAGVAGLAYQIALKYRNSIQRDFDPRGGSERKRLLTPLIQHKEKGPAVPAPPSSPTAVEVCTRYERESASAA